MRSLTLFVLSITLFIHSTAQPCNQTVVASYTPAIVCSGRDVQLNVTTITGAGYNWAGPGGYNTMQQNPLLSSISLSASGDYIVTVTDGSCTYMDTVTIMVNPTPVMSTIISNSPVCYGDTLTMDAATTAMVPLYGYWWGPNSFSALTAPFQPINRLYADSGMAGAYKMVGQSAAGCFSDTAYFNISVLHNVSPSVTIMVDTIKTGPYTPVKFTAHVIDGGAQPIFQWRKNSVDIAGAHDSTYTGISSVNLQHGDTITVAVTADTACGQTSISNVLIYYMDLGVHDMTKGNSIALYPNPNAGRFTLYFSGTVKGRAEIINSIGMVVFSRYLINEKELKIDMPRDIANGIYLLRLNIGGIVEYSRFTVYK